MRPDAITNTCTQLERKARFIDWTVSATAAGLLVAIMFAPLFYRSRSGPSSSNWVLYLSLASAVQWRIALELVIAGVATWCRRSRFPLVSTLALALIVTEFSYWWLTNISSYVFSGADVPIERLLMANCAGIWDVWVFGVALFALVARMKYLQHLTPRSRLS